MNIAYEYKCENSQQNTSKSDPAVYKKDYATWLTDIYPRHAKLVQHTKISHIRHTYRIKLVEPHMIVSIGKKKCSKKSNTLSQ